MTHIILRDEPSFSIPFGLTVVLLAVIKGVPQARRTFGTNAEIVLIF
jgi:hypothetical protein